MQDDGKSNFGVRIAVSLYWEKRPDIFVISRSAATRQSPG